MQASCWLKPNSTTFTAFVMIRLFFVFSFHVCITQTYTLSASLTLICVASTYASPVQDKKTTTCLFSYHVHFASQCTVCRPPENKTDCCDGLPCLCCSCYSYTELINVFSLCWLRCQSLEQQSRLSRQSVWRLRRRGRGREKQNQTDVCSDSETSVFFNCGAQNSKQQVYSRVLFSCCMTCSWWVPPLPLPHTVPNSKQHVHFIPDGSASYYRHKLYFVFKLYLISYWPLPFKEMFEHNKMVNIFIYLFFSKWHHSKGMCKEF